MSGDLLERYPATALVMFAALALGTAGIVYAVARLLLGSFRDAGRYEQPMTTLMLILGTISVIALIGGLFTRDESAYTIAATGVGAFAGALTARAQWVATHPDPDDLEQEDGA